MSRFTPNVTFHLNFHRHHFPSHTYFLSCPESRPMLLFISTATFIISQVTLTYLFLRYCKFLLGGVFYVPSNSAIFWRFFGSFVSRVFFCALRFSNLWQFLEVFFSCVIFCALQFCNFWQFWGGIVLRVIFCALLFSAIFGNFWRFCFRAQFFVPSSHLLPLLMSAVTPFSLSFPESRFW
jgi:hypothetical protein